jgi:hypothetical protein
MLDHYLHSARTAAARFGPQHYPLEQEPLQDKTVLAPVGSNQHAMGWFAAEHEVLPAVTAVAASTGFDDHAWQIPANFARYPYSYGQWYDGTEILNAAVTAADRLGDKHAQASVLHVSRLIGLKVSSYTLVNEQFSRALQLYSELGD